MLKMLMVFRATTLLVLVILFPHATNAKELIIKTVITNGFGLTIQKASQNAAENALTQVVGSFIDTRTLLEKRTEITNGILKRSKHIKKDIQDYSQGSIKFFEILKVSQNGAIFTVVARIDVRIEDFRAYIKELATGSTKIGRGLFAQMKSEQDNISDKLDLVIDKIIRPILEGEVHEISVSQPVPLSEFIRKCPGLMENTFFSLGQRSKYSRSNFSICKGISKISNRPSIAVFEFSISLKRDFFENLSKIFENVANKKKRYFGNENINDKLEWGRQDLFVVIDNYDSNQTAVASFFTLDNFDQDTSSRKGYGKQVLYPYESMKVERGLSRGCSTHNDLFFGIFNSSGKVLKSSVLQTCRENVRGTIGDMTEIPLLSLYAQSMSGPRLILAKRKYFLLVKLPPAVLNRAASIEIRYVQN